MRVCLSQIGWLEPGAETGGSKHYMGVDGTAVRRLGPMRGGGQDLVMQRWQREIGDGGAAEGKAKRMGQAISET